MPSPISSAFARLNDSRSLTHGVVSTALAAGLTLIEPRRLGHGRRVLYRVAVAAVTAWTTWVAVRTDDAVAPAVRAGVTVGAAGVALGLADAGEALDARMSDGLVRAGATKPRWVLAAAGAALSIASWAIARSDAGPGAPDAGEEDAAEEELVEVPADVRALVARLLGASEAHGAPELRAQLDAAKAIAFEGPDADAFWPGIGFAVPADLPLAVPGDATFPVLGRYRALDDRTFDVYLIVQDGRIATLAVSEGRDWSADELESWIDAGRGIHELTDWPTADAIDLHVETSSGLRPHE